MVQQLVSSQSQPQTGFWSDTEETTNSLSHNITSVMQNQHIVIIL